MTYLTCYLYIAGNGVTQTCLLISTSRRDARHIYLRSKVPKVLWTMRLVSLACLSKLCWSKTCLPNFDSWNCEIKQAWLFNIIIHYPFCWIDSADEDKTNIFICWRNTKTSPHPTTKSRNIENFGFPITNFRSVPNKYCQQTFSVPVQDLLTKECYLDRYIFCKCV